MLNGEAVDTGVFVDAGVTFASVDGACKVGREFADEAMVWEAEIAKLEDEADEVGEEGWSVNASIHEDSSIYVGVRHYGEGGGLS